MSQVHYKFKSSKDYDSATFDGHSISVFDLKKEILIAKGLKGPDDLQLTHAESGEEYYDDATLIPRNTSILVARVPAKPGRGGAQRYLEGAGPIPRGGGMTRNVFEKPTQSSTHDLMGAKVYKNTTSLLAEDGPPAPAVDTSHMTEEERMKFVFEQSASYWDKTQEGMASAPYRPLAKFQGVVRNPPPGGQKPGGSGGPSGGPSAGPYQRQPMEQQQRPPPNTYVCYRCGKKGEHWIQFCPTNNDKSFEPIGIKKTTGIPRSFLKTVESDSLQSKKGVMVTQDGNLVVATTNDYEWKKFHEKSKAALTSEEAYATAPVPDDMKCSICSMLLKSAVRAPCCGTNFCDECIRNYLVQPPKGEEPFNCQNCHQYLVPDQLIPNIELRQRAEQHLRDWVKNRGGAATMNSRGGTPSLESEANGSGSGPSQQDSPSGPKAIGDNDSFTGGAVVETGQKRRMSNDSQDPVNGGDHDRDQPSWKNKKPYNSHHNNNFNQQNFNRNRMPMHGPGGMGPMDPALMFPEGVPPGFYEMMQDPNFFMDPSFFGPNGVSPFMMPGFMPPFGPEFGGMPGPGVPGGPGGPGVPSGPGGPEMWGMGRGIPGLPPMGPGFPTPRIGFSDSPGAGRGRGRGGWQDHANNANNRGPGQQQQTLNQGPNRPGSRPEGGSNVASGSGDGPVQRSASVEGTKDITTPSHRNSVSSGNGRFDDDIDMSLVPTGPRASRRLSFDDNDEDIPTGPRAGPGPDFEYDRRSGGGRSESPPTAPLADRLRNRSGSRARSERADYSSDRDRSRHRESRDRSRDKSTDRSKPEKGRDSGRDREREKERDRDKDRTRDRDNRNGDRDRDSDRRRDSSRDKRDDRSRSSRHDRDRNDRRYDRRDDRRDERRSDKRDDKRDDRRDDRDRESSHHHPERPERSDRNEHRHHRDRGHDSSADQGSRHAREVLTGASSTRHETADPQREYELKRQNVMNMRAGGGTKTSENNGQEEVVSFKGRASAARSNAREKGDRGRTSGRRGYGHEDDEKEDEEDEDEAGRKDNGVVEEIRFRRGDSDKAELAAMGLVSNSARERERREHERRGVRD
ncbi:E3 ubiquitin-protein ligase rbbp6 [Gamsiella multidivaricata]|nr:E3 ubiquitin-protein ligase rbbp6 [Gamsiella multidivaricata]